MIGYFEYKCWTHHTIPQTKQNETNDEHRTASQGESEAHV